MSKKNDGIKVFWANQLKDIMKFSNYLYVYASEPLLQLLQSVQEQTVYPNEILIIDGFNK
jgi:hypothetical protein